MPPSLRRKYPYSWWTSRSVPDTGTDGTWWHSPHLERSIGAAYGKNWDSQMYRYHTPTLSYDAYFFIDRTTAATPLP